MSSPLKKRNSAADRRGTPRVLMNFRRFRAELRETKGKGVIGSRLFLLDLHVDGAGIFLEKVLPIGTKVSLCVHSDESNFLVIRGHIRWCSQHNFSSKIRSQNPFPFRAGLKFDNITPNTMKLIQDFINRASSPDWTET